MATKEILAILQSVFQTNSSNIYKVLVAHSKFVKNKNFGLADKGPILLQEHGNSVFFKNIKIRELKN